MSSLPTPLAQQREWDWLPENSPTVVSDGTGKPRLRFPNGMVTTMHLPLMAKLGVWPDGRREPGPLSPEWVEWLMGFPAGWTA